MKFQRVAIALSVINTLALVFVLSAVRSSADPAVSPIVRTRVIELIEAFAGGLAGLDALRLGGVVAEVTGVSISCLS